MPARKKATARRERSAAKGGRAVPPPSKLELHSKIGGRVLRFLNTAQRPEDLTVRPQEIRIHPEAHDFKRPDLHEPEGQPERAPLLELDLARRIIGWRKENSPLYGFVNFRDVRELIPDRSLRSMHVAFGPGTHGLWADPFEIPAGHDTPVHAAVLHTGRVLFFGLPGGNNTSVWDPGSGAAGFSSPSPQPTDSLFCAGQSFLSDGQLLVVGGGGDGTVTGWHNHGWKFEPVPGTGSWARTAGNGTPGSGDMAFTRWYPTCVTMGDEPGRVLVVNGASGNGPMEMYFEATDRFERVWGPGGPGGPGVPADTSADRVFPQLYPGLNLLPGSEVFYTPTGWSGSPPPSAYFNFASTSPPVTGAWSAVGAADAAALDRVRGMAVLLLQNTYPFVQVMVTGGGTSPGTYQLINLSQFVPQWGPANALPDGLARTNVNAVVLPDGTVFVSGGLPQGGTPSSGGQCWIYDPAASTWRPMDELSYARQYHSVAVLLPDGRVAAAGGNRTIEVFSPPYLFNADESPAARPVISSPSPNEVVHHGNGFTIETPNASDIEKVVLARPMAVTHQTDSEQRVIPLSFTQTGPTTLNATAPNGWHPHAMAPRGYYMLFILNGDGVPSLAKFILLH